ncbi:MAG: TRAP transporter large permease [Bacillota bacterium]|nr:TRAP transporter large permease [Bacillota bacterium]
MSALLVLFGSFIFCLMLSVPVGYAIGISSIISMWIFPDYIMASISTYAISGTNSFPLLAVPLFVLSGSLMTSGGIAQSLVRCANSILGFVRGGLSIVTTAACMFFAAISGSGTATTAAIGTFMIPEMVKAGYDRPFAGAICAAAGTTGIIIPPSMMFVIYGYVASVSVSDLFIAGIIPGILMGLALMVVCYIYCRMKGYKGTGEKPMLRNIAKTAKQSIWALILPVIILGSIYTGIVTPTECAALAVVYSLVIGILVYKELTLKKIVAALLETARVTGMGMYMLGFAAIFSSVLTMEKIPQLFITFMQDLHLSSLGVLIIINLLLLIAGLFIDNIPATIIFTPILLPMVTAAGMHPVTFGVVITLNLAIGYLTPPYGIGLYYASIIGKVPIGPMMKTTVWMILALLVVLAVTTYLPWATLGLLGYR